MMLIPLTEAELVALIEGTRAELGRQVPLAWGTRGTALEYIPGGGSRWALDILAEMRGVSA